MTYCLTQMADRCKIFATLYRFSQRGLNEFQQVLASLMLDDAEVCVGNTGSPVSCGARESMLSFMEAVGKTGEELLKLQDEGEFKMIIEEAIARERVKENTS